MKEEFVNIIEHNSTEVFSKVDLRKNSLLWKIALRSMLTSLRDEGLLLEDLTDEAIIYIADKVSLKIPRVFVTQSIVYIITEIFDCSPVENTSKTVDVGDDFISKMKPEDFKEKEYDEEFLKLLGAENPDEW